jgi:hypothetical protein
MAPLEVADALQLAEHCGPERRWTVVGTSNTDRQTYLEALRWLTTVLAQAKVRVSVTG